MSWQWYEFLGVSVLPVLVYHARFTIEETEMAALKWQD
jgi:hypothetical protein